MEQTDAKSVSDSGDNAGGNTTAISEKVAAGLESDENINIHQEDGHCLKTQLKVTEEGTLDVDLDDETFGLSKLLKPVLEYNVQENATSSPRRSLVIPELFSKAPSSMNIVIHIVGSRGDVQPFISLGKVLKEKFSHRIRIATHLTFQSFVEQNGLEFFNIGGDPTELMAYMVKNPGLIPDLHTLKSGDVGRRRDSIYEILNGCWRSCIEPGDGTTPESELHSYHFETKAEPFIADAIIANPPSFAHVHCAEKLGIPLHMMFTMPWSPTQSFPHPLVNIKSSNADREMTNYISYTLVDMMTWQGLGDVINKFRNRALNLGPVSVMWAPGMTHRLRIPFTYCWSPALIPKPADWGQHISISGFYFLSLASDYRPDPALLEFLNAGPPPLYIGFGSIVVDDPDAMTGLIFKAVKLAGVRALVSKGWGGLGADESEKSDSIYMLGNVPHDWLFQHVSAVVHHGGAGTTAAGILAGRPTVVVPFFGDQPFWGAMIARAGAGPQPVAYKHLTAESLADQIKFALRPATVEKAILLSAEMSSERGAESGVDYFHSSLPENMRCSLLPGHVAVWRLNEKNVLFSAKAAIILRNKNLIDMKDLRLHRSQEYATEDGPWDPVSGIASVLLGTLSTFVVGAADLPSGAFHALKKGLLSRHNSLDAKASSETNSIYINRKQSSSTISSRSPSIFPRSSISDVSTDQKQLNQSLTDTSEGSFLSKESSLESDASSTSTASAENSSTSRQRHHHTLHESIDHAKHAVSQVAEIGLAVPMDFANSIAQGFHNVPKLYQDHTVRPQENVTGMKSGLQAAGKDFAHGIYDGVTGIITQPISGAIEEGPLGLLKGIGKGLGGLVLKPTAGLFSVPADTIKGAYKELRKTGDARLEEHIMASRITQGEREAKGMTAHDETELAELWAIVKKRAFEPTPRRVQTLRMKICPKCRKRHAGVGEELVVGQEDDHEHNDDSLEISPDQPSTQAIKEFSIAEVDPRLSKRSATATVTTSTVVV